MPASLAHPYPAEIGQQPYWPVQHTVCKLEAIFPLSFTFAVSSLHESRARPVEVPFQKQHRVKKELQRAELAV